MVSGPEAGDMLLPKTGNNPIPRESAGQGYMDALYNYQQYTPYPLFLQPHTAKLPVSLGSGGRREQSCGPRSAEL